jgi:hypothetical protein
MRNSYKKLAKYLKSRDHVQDLDVDGRIILKCILHKYGVNELAGFMWLRIKYSGRLL